MIDLGLFFIYTSIEQFPVWAVFDTYFYVEVTNLIVHNRYIGSDAIYFPLHILWQDICLWFAHSHGVKKFGPASATILELMNNRKCSSA